LLRIRQPDKTMASTLTHFRLPYGQPFHQSPPSFFWLRFPHLVDWTPVHFILGNKLNSHARARLSCSAGRNDNVRVAVFASKQQRSCRRL
jgi:hypothetical protein